MNQSELERAVGEILIDADRLQSRIHELGEEITHDYAGRSCSSSASSKAPSSSWPT